MLNNYGHVNILVVDLVVVVVVVVVVADVVLILPLAIVTEWVGPGEVDWEVEDMAVEGTREEREVGASGLTRIKKE